MRALRHPALGLALVLIGISALPGHLVQIANVWLFDDAPPMSIWVPMVLTAVLSALQVATGWAMTRQRAIIVLALGDAVLRELAIARRAATSTWVCSHHSPT